MSMETMVSLHLAATAVMTGVIWFVQLIQYPWFHAVPADRFVTYHRHYTQRIGLIVGPAMLVELGTGVLLIFLLAGTPRTFMAGGLGILAIIWLSTMFLQIPCHNRLGRGYDEGTHRRLVNTNWIRTIGWSARLVLLLVYNP